MSKILKNTPDWIKDILSNHRNSSGRIVVKMVHECCNQECQAPESFECFLDIVDEIHSDDDGAPVYSTEILDKKGWWFYPHPYNRFNTLVLCPGCSEEFKKYDIDKIFKKICEENHKRFLDSVK